MSSPIFEIVTTTAGAVSIRNNVVNEIMHNPVGPWAEANALYVAPSRLRERLASVGPELVIFDVGLGAAANALAALHCARLAGGVRPLRLISFERDLDLLKFALENSAQFAHFSGFEDAISTLLATGRWAEPGICWELRHGDFLQLIEREEFLADLIFFDPYSHKVNLDMWTVRAFAKLRERSSNSGALLFTYSRATPIRTAILHAGFFIGKGPATGLKDETTQAATKLEDLAEPLGRPWLERWQRSHKPDPLGATPEECVAIRRAILAHPQFS